MSLCSMFQREGVVLLSDASQTRRLIAEQILASEETSYSFATPILHDG